MSENQPQRVSIGRRFWRDIFVLQTWTNVVAVIFILAFLWPVLSFTKDQLIAMAIIVSGLVGLVMPPYGAMFYRWCAPVREYLGAPEPEQTPTELRSSAFGAVIDLPRRQFFGSLCMWLAFGFPASLYLHHAYDDFSLDSTIVLCAAITSGGLLSSIIGFFALKNHLSRIRGELARSLTDPQFRRSAVHQINTALGAQSDACDQVVSVLESMLGRNRETEESGAKLDGTMRELVAEAVDLRAAVEHFTLDEGDA
jgi:hypothetical protein